MNLEQKAIEIIRENGYIVKEGRNRWRPRFRAEIYTNQLVWIGVFTQCGLIHFAEIVEDRHQ